MTYNNGEGSMHGFTLLPMAALADELDYVAMFARWKSRLI